MGLPKKARALGTTMRTDDRPVDVRLDSDGDVGTRRSRLAGIPLQSQNLAGWL
jgi:hypothetical protein